MTYINAIIQRIFTSTLYALFAYTLSLIFVFINFFYLAHGSSQ